jgi:hypothetical protein
VEEAAPSNLPPPPAESELVSVHSLDLANLPAVSAPVESLSAPAEVSASSVVEAHLAEPTTPETASVTTGIISSAEPPPVPVEPMNIEASSEFLAAEPTFTVAAATLGQTGVLHGDPLSVDQAMVHHSLVGAHESAQTLPGTESLADESANAGLHGLPPGFIQPLAEPPPPA